MSKIFEIYTKKIIVDGRLEVIELLSKKYPDHIIAKILNTKQQNINWYRSKLKGKKK